MARKAAKSEWQVKAEEARRNAQAVQSAWDAAAKMLPSMVPQAMDTFQDAAVAEDAERTQRNWSNILEYIDRERGMAQAKVESFHAELGRTFEKADGRTALEILAWSTDTVRSAATAEVYGRALSFLTERGSARFREWLHQSAHRAAREAFPRSSSAMSNLAEAARAEAWANLSESFLSGWLGARF